MVEVSFDEHVWERSRDLFMGIMCNTNFATLYHFQYTYETMMSGIKNLSFIGSLNPYVRNLVDFIFD